MAIHINNKNFNIGCVWQGHHLTFNFFRFYDPKFLNQLKFFGVNLFSFQKSTDNYFLKCPYFKKKKSHIKISISKMNSSTLNKNENIFWVSQM